MNPGEEYRFIGPAGAEFVVTVDVAFSAEYVAKMVRTGEWTPVVQPEPKRAPARKPASK